MANSKVRYEFTNPFDKDAVEIFCDKKKLAKHFREVEMEFEKNEGHCIPAKLHTLFHARLLRDNEEFTKLIGPRTSRYNETIPPIDYLFNQTELDNIIYITLYYHQILFDLWSQPYNRNATKDIQLTKSDLKKIEQFLKKVEGFDLLSNQKNSTLIKIFPFHLEIKSFKITEAIIDLLRQMVDKEESKSIGKRVKQIREIESFDISVYGHTGRGTNYEVELTQKFISLLYDFVVKFKVIQKRKTVSKLSDRTIYGFIADILSITTLPSMKSKGKAVLAWDYTDENYDREEQIKRIESWLYNRGKKQPKQKN